MSLSSNGDNEAENTEDIRGGEAYNDQGILAGAQISDVIKFNDKRGREVQLTPIMVDFRRLIQSGGTAEVVPGVSSLGRSSFRNRMPN